MTTPMQVAYRLVTLNVPSEACLYFANNCPAEKVQYKHLLPQDHLNGYNILADCVMDGLTWDETPQGHTFWHKLYNFLRTRHHPEKWVAPGLAASASGNDIPVPKKCSLPVVEINKHAHSH